MKPVIGIDLGGTKTVAALVTEDGRVSERLEAPTPSLVGPDAVLDVVAGLIRTLTAGNAALIDGVGVGSAGIVTADGRIQSATDTFRDWVGTDLPSELRRRLTQLRHLPIAVCNDVDAHLLGELWLGAARGLRSALMVTVGTGIGGALLVDGRPWAGFRNAAGEIGHLPVPGAEGVRCPCGRPGHLEALASGPAISRGYGDRTGQRLEARAIFERASAGDEVARQVIHAAASGLGRGLAGIITTVDPQAVVVGGGVAEAGPMWWRPMEDTCRSELVTAFAEIEIRPAQLPRSAAVLGAARQAFELAGGVRS